MAEKLVNVILDAKPMAMLAIKGKSITKALQEIGDYLVNLSNKAFTDQEWQGARWIARSVPNVPGIVRDLEKGPNIQDKRFNSRPALRDTDALMNSIKSRTIGSRAIEVGSSSQYAELMHDGGPWSEEVSNTVQKNLLVMLDQSERAASGPIKENAHIFRFLLNRKEISGKVPPRQFLGPPKDAKEVFGNIIAKYLDPRNTKVGA